MLTESAKAIQTVRRAVAACIAIGLSHVIAGREPQSLHINVDAAAQWDVSSPDRKVHKGSTIELNPGDLISISVHNVQARDQLGITGSAAFPISPYPSTLPQGDIRSLVSQPASLSGYFEPTVDGPAKDFQNEIQSIAATLQGGADAFDDMLTQGQVASEEELKPRFAIDGSLDTLTEHLNLLRLNFHKLPIQVQLAYPQSAGVMDYWTKAIDEIRSRAKGLWDAVKRDLGTVKDRGTRQFVYRYDGGAQTLSLLVGASPNAGFERHVDLLRIEQPHPTKPEKRYVVSVGTYLDRLASQELTSNGLTSNPSAFDLHLNLKTPEFRKWLPLRAFVGWGISPDETPRYTFGLSWRPFRENPNFWLDLGLEQGKFAYVFTGIDFNLAESHKVLWIPFIGISTRIWGF